MENTSTTPKKRGPKPKTLNTVVQEPTTPQQTASNYVPKVKRVQKKNEIRVYKMRKKSGATFLLQQSGVLAFSDGAQREIRYCPNEPSIYRDEQNDASKRKAIVFTDGELYVRPDQINLYSYLDAHPENESNGGNRFYLHKEEAVAERKLVDEFEVHDAITLIRNKDLNELLSVAISFGVDIDKPVNEIKHDLMYFAKKDPSTFIEAFDNPIVQMKTMVSQAHKYQIINLREDKVVWYDTNKLILSVPAGKDPADVFTRYCMTEDAAPVVEQIQKQLI